MIKDQDKLGVIGDFLVLVMYKGNRAAFDHSNATHIIRFKGLEGTKHGCDVYLGRANALRGKLVNIVVNEMSLNGKGMFKQVYDLRYWDAEDAKKLELPILELDIGTYIDAYKRVQPHNRPRERHNRSVVLLIPNGYKCEGKLLEDNPVNDLNNISVVYLKGNPKRRSNDPCYPYCLASSHAEELAGIIRGDFKFNGFQVLAYKLIQASPWVVKLLKEAINTTEYELPHGIDNPNLSNRSRQINDWKVQILNEATGDILIQRLKLGSPTKITASKQTCYNYGYAYIAEHPGTSFNVLPVSKIVDTNYYVLALEDSEGNRLGVIKGMRCASSTGGFKHRNSWRGVSLTSVEAKRFCDEYNAVLRTSGDKAVIVPLSEYPTNQDEREEYFIYNFWSV